jgi:hypothetical protein
VLPVKIESSDVAVNSSANIALLRIVRVNDYTGIYADTITGTTISPCYPYIPQYNFTDSVIYKSLAAINDSTVIMDLAIPGMFSVDRSLIMHIRSDNSVWLEIYDDDTNGILTFGLVNSVLHPFCQQAIGYFNIPYYYYTEAFSIKERLRKL